MSGDADQRAGHIAEGVADVWRGSYASDRLEIPLSIVAMMQFESTALLRQVGPQAKSWLTERYKGITKETLTGWCTEQLSTIAAFRPRFMGALEPFTEHWKPEVFTDTVRYAGVQVVQTALRRGIIDVSQESDSTDLLGSTLMALRSRGAMQARGQFLTPLSVAQMMSDMLTPDLPAGASILEPAVGTGGLLRAAAQTLKRNGVDPTSCYWEAWDTDATAIACLSVNSLLWGLGQNVLFIHGNTLGPDLDVVRRRTIEKQNADMVEMEGIWTEAIEQAQKQHQQEERIRKMFALLGELVAGDESKKRGPSAVEAQVAQAEQALDLIQFAKANEPERLQAKPGSAAPPTYVVDHRRSRVREVPEGQEPLFFTPPGLVSF